MTIPEVDWPILPDGYRWRVGREMYHLDFGSYYSDEYYVYIEKKITWTSGIFKKTNKTKWSTSVQKVVQESDDTPAVVLSAENIETTAYAALDDLETLFAKRDAEDKFFGTHP